MSSLFCWPRVRCVEASCVVAIFLGSVDPRRDFVEYKVCVGGPVRAELQQVVLMFACCCIVIEKTESRRHGLSPKFACSKFRFATHGSLAWCRPVSLASRLRTQPKCETHSAIKRAERVAIAVLLPLRTLPSFLQPAVVSSVEQRVQSVVSQIPSK